MDVIYTGRTRWLRENLKIKKDCTYAVHRIMYAPSIGVFIGLTEFQIKNSVHGSTFGAKDFKTPDGRRIDLVRARPDTAASSVFGDTPLYLVDYRLVDGIEYVRCRVFDGNADDLTPYPYDQFEHQM